MDNLKGSIKTLFVIGIVVLTTILLSILTLMNVFQFMDATDFQVRESLQKGKFAADWIREFCRWKKKLWVWRWR